MQNDIYVPAIQDWVGEYVTEQPNKKEGTSMILYTRHEGIMSDSLKRIAKLEQKVDDLKISLQRSNKAHNKETLEANKWAKEASSLKEENAMLLKAIDDQDKEIVALKRQWAESEDTADWDAYNGGDWQLAEAKDKDFVLCHYFVTNDKLSASGDRLVSMNLVLGKLLNPESDNQTDECQIDHDHYCTTHGWQYCPTRDD